MASIDSDLKTVLSELRSAVDDFETSPSDETGEWICIHSRSALNLFEEKSCWTNEVDEDLRHLLGEELLARAEKLLIKYCSGNENTHCNVYLERVQERKTEVLSFDLERVFAEIYR
jgi:hypothetical protein